MEPGGAGKVGVCTKNGQVFDKTKKAIEKC